MSCSPKKSVKKEGGDGAQTPSDDVKEPMHETPPELTQDVFPTDLVLDGKPVGAPVVELNAPLTPERVEQMAKPLKPTGRALCVYSPRHNRSFMKQAARDIREGRVENTGHVRLPDGQEIPPGPTYMTTDSPELQKLIGAGVVLAGSKPRGKRARGLVKQSAKAVE